MPPRPDEADVVYDFQVAGWHLCLIEDIEWAEATLRTFEHRSYTRATDEVGPSIVFRWPVEPT
jgi:hypothetical protein